MYQVTRKNRIKETLQLCNADGSVAYDIPVDLNVDVISARVNKAYETLGMAQIELEKDSSSPALLTAYGNAVIAIFDVLFGVDGSKKIVSFYEGNYTEMLLDLFPFINDEIMPQIQAASAERKRQLLETAQRMAGK